MGLLHHPFGFSLIWHFLGITFQLLNCFVWLRITDEGSVPEMRIWSILLIKSDLKWCIHLGRSIFLYIVLMTIFGKSLDLHAHASTTKYNRQLLRCLIFHQQRFPTLQFEASAPIPHLQSTHQMSQFCNR